MVKAAAVVTGDGAELQSLLDGMFFGEVPNFSLSAVVATEPGSAALRRAEAQHIATYTVDAGIFPNAATFTRALSAKLQDIDAEMAVLVSLEPEPAESFYREYSGRCVCLRLSERLKGAAERGDGAVVATALLADADGSEARRYGRVSAEVKPGDSVSQLRRRLVESGAGELLTKALKDYMREFH